MVVILRPLSWYKDLSNVRRRREYGFFLVEGKRAVEQIQKTAPSSIEEILATETASKTTGRFSCALRILTDRQFKTICSSKTPQGIAAVVRIPENSYGEDLPKQTGDRLLLLEGVQDPGNVGTLIRTASAFDYGGVIMSEECADPFSPKAVQASAGSTMSVWIRRTDGYRGIVKKIQERGFKLIAADVEGGTLTARYSLPLRCVLMLGSEGAGLSDQLLALADEKIRIPINDRMVESLNVATAGALLMFLGSPNEKQ
ncbi:MAG: RNA methyltransferase [Chitinispirillaceae bacterium]